jgi:hypothetical protein
MGVERQRRDVKDGGEGHGKVRKYGAERLKESGKRIKDV